jgi:hypothetical protein
LAHYLFLKIYLLPIVIKIFLLCTQDLNAGTIANDTAMPMFTNEVQGKSSTMATSFIQGGQANATMSLFASDMYESSSNISAPFFQGGLTGLLLGVEQDATLSKSAKKLHFNE